MCDQIVLKELPKLGSDIPREPAWSDRNYIKHVVCEGARFHVLSYSTAGTRCSEPRCIINKPASPASAESEAAGKASEQQKWEVAVSDDGSLIWLQEVHQGLHPKQLFSALDESEENRDLLDIVADAHNASLLSLQQELQKKEEALRLVLPMAKGWAAEHPVGNNQKFVDQAEIALGEKEARGQGPDVILADGSQHVSEVVSKRVREAARQIESAVGFAIDKHLPLPEAEQFAEIISEALGKPEADVNADRAPTTDGALTDSQRLDWLERHATTRWPYGNQLLIAAGMTLPVPVEKKPTIRQAIDAAISEHGGSSTVGGEQQRDLGEQGTV